MSILRIEPVRAGRDDAPYECVAENGVGDAVSAEATLTVYEGEFIFHGNQRQHPMLQLTNLCVTRSLTTTMSPTSWPGLGTNIGKVKRIPLAAS